MQYFPFAFVLSSKYASHLASYLRLLTLSPSFSTSLMYNDSVQLALRTRRNALT